MPTLIAPTAPTTNLPPTVSPASLTLSFGGVEFTLNPSDIESEVSFKNNGQGVLLCLEKFNGSLQVSLKGNASAASTTTTSTTTLTTPTPARTIEEEPNSPPTAQRPPDAPSVQKKLPFPKQHNALKNKNKTKKSKVEASKRKEKKRPVEAIKATSTVVKKTRIEDKDVQSAAPSRAPTLCPTMEAAENMLNTQHIADLSQTVDALDNQSSSQSGHESDNYTNTNIHNMFRFPSVDKPQDSVRDILNRVNNSTDSVATVQGDDEANSIASIAPDTLAGLVVKGQPTTVENQTAAPQVINTNEVSTKQPPVNPTTPCPRWGHTMTRLQDGRLLVYGGQSFDLNGNPTILSDVHLYDLSKRTWSSPVNSKGEKRQWHSATFVPHRQVLVACFGETMDPVKNKLVTSDTIRVLDTDIMLWYPPAVSGDVPSGRSGHTLTYLPGSSDLILFGGNRGNKWLNNVSVLDTARWIWSTPVVKGSAPKPRSYHSATSVRGRDGAYKIVIFGGNNKASSFNSVHVLEAKEDGWRWTHPSVSGIAPFPRTGHSATLLDDERSIAIYGGWDPNEEDAETGEDCIHKSSFLLDTETWAWSAGPKIEPGGSGTDNEFVEDCGPKRCGHTASLNNDSGEIVVFGGRIPGERLAGDFQRLASERKMVGLNEN